MKVELKILQETTTSVDAIIELIAENGEDRRLLGKLRDAKLVITATPANTVERADLGLHSEQPANPPRMTHAQEHKLMVEQRQRGD